MKILQSFCPIFNEKNVLEKLDQDELEKCSEGLFRPLEMVLLPGSRIEIVEDDQGQLAIKYPEHDGDRVFYTHAMFLKQNLEVDLEVEELTLNHILEALYAFKGAPYVWGANWRLSDKNEFFDSFNGFSKNIQKHLAYLFSGLDCSGLLYAATKARVPRNTSQLVSYGRSINIDGFSNHQIKRVVKPLDLLVWKGHVLVFLEENYLIESRLGRGVVIVDADERLDEIRQKRRPCQTPSSDTFVIRRWI